jgi:hypothetical protein
MADTNHRGPINSMGSMEQEQATGFSIQPFDGPSGSYQGYAMLDPHGGNFSKDGLTAGRVPGIMISPDFIAVDAVPQAISSNVLAAAQVLTAAAPMALATVGVTNFSAGAASIAVGVPVMATGASTVVNLICLDFGYTTGTTIANSTVVAVNDTTLFSAGQWILIGNVANAAGTASLFTQVQTTLNATSIGVLPAPATALGAPIGGTNIFSAGLYPPSTPFGPNTVTPTVHSKAIGAGLLRITNPRESLARNISVQASSLAAGTGTILITGLDLYNNTVAELITATGTTMAGGKKCFKYVISAVPVTLGTTITVSYSLGVGDVFETPFRLDEAQQLSAQWGATAVTNGVGVLTAVNSLATNTTGDVRGTITVGAGAGGTPVTAAASTNNVLRLYMQQSPAITSLINTTPNNLVPLFGVAQATA